jgi:hypothetical protein
LTARQLIDAGREHIAAGRSTEAVRCFTLAADPVGSDSALAIEARSMLAAAYLLPGTQRPSLALRHVRTVAAAKSAGGEALARCAMVALCAGDPALAEELAGRADNHPDALPILAAARARLGDRRGLGTILATREQTGGTATFWHRMIFESVRRRWWREALAAVRLLRRSGMKAPGGAEVARRAMLPPALLSTVLVLGGLLAVVLPLPFGAVPLTAMAGSAALVVPPDLVEGRAALGWSRMAWALTAAVIAVVHWLG